MLRKNSLPFGGIQLGALRTTKDCSGIQTGLTPFYHILVITGDFFQLPPVVELTGPGQPPQPVKFVFESKGWKAAALKTVVLQQSVKSP